MSPRKTISMYLKNIPEVPLCEIQVYIFGVQ